METDNERADAVETMACPQCEGAVETVQHPEVFRYGEGASAVDLPVVLPVRRCLGCGLEFLDHQAERIKHAALCRHFGVLTPWEIREIRARHGLSRAAFAKLTGLGAASLGRWETGNSIQTLANDRYLRLLAEPGGIQRLSAITQRGPIAQGASTQEPRSSRFRCLRPDEGARREARAFRLAVEAA